MDQMSQHSMSEQHAGYKDCRNVTQKFWSELSAIGQNKPWHHLINISGDKIGLADCVF